MPPNEKPTTSNRSRLIARQKSTQSFVNAATVDGVSPDEPPMPG